MMNPNIQLGVRLHTLYKLILDRQLPTRRYNQIWDCCCDHGYLGRALLNAQCCEQVIFVDQVPDIMEKLANRLKTVPSGYRLITGDAADLKLGFSQSHLVILAGVGGEQIVDMVESIEARNPEAFVDYLFCPVNHARVLRQYLHQSPNRFGLRHEQIVQDRGRYYEIIHITTRPSENPLQRLSLTGHMWDFTCEQHRAYHAKLLRYFRARARNVADTAAVQALEDYESLNSITASGTPDR